MTSLQTPNPGAPLAIERGCLCPELVNAYGKGVMTASGKPWFVLTATCPLHGHGNWRDPCTAR